jgi:hypothetical protein
MENLKGSEQAYGSELDLGSLPSSDVGVMYSEYHTFFPVFNTKEWRNPIQFFVPASQTLYTDLSSAYLYLRMRILKADDTNLTSTDTVVPTHNLFRSLFSSCEVMMNFTVVSTSSSMYSYKSHILDTLRHGRNYQESQL